MTNIRVWRLDYQRFSVLKKYIRFPKFIGWAYLMWQNCSSSKQKLFTLFILQLGKSIYSWKILGAMEWSLVLLFWPSTRKRIPGFISRRQFKLYFCRFCLLFWHFSVFHSQTKIIRWFYSFSKCWLCTIRLYSHRNCCSRISCLQERACRLR